ncbi:hypothetical protein SEVIR_2G215950v4 [Setaria viridis]
MALPASRRRTRCTWPPPSPTPPFRPSWIRSTRTPSLPRPLRAASASSLLHVVDRFSNDRDPVFTGAFWTELFRLSGVTLCLSSAFHPQTDGQSEVTNKVLGVYLRCLADDWPRSWLRWLPWTEHCYSTSYQTALQATPFEVVYGRPTPILAAYQPGLSRVASLDKQFVERDAFLAAVWERLLRA